MPASTLDVAGALPQGGPGAETTDPATDDDNSQSGTAKDIQEPAASWSSPPVQAVAAASSGRQRWIRSQTANIVFGVFIVANSIILGVETDHRQEKAGPEAAMVWFCIDSLFNVVFLCECILRMEAERLRWCTDPWNVADAILVVFGIIDVWILGVVNRSKNSDMRLLTVTRIFRLLRFTRILRILRLFKAFHELVLLISAIAGAVAAMAWSVSLIGIVLLVSAMFTTRLIGHDCCGPEDTFQDESYVQYFGTVPRSLFTLFQIATLENWPEIARGAFNDSILLVAFYIVFIMFSNIVLLNTVAGIVVENVLFVASKEEQQRKEAAENEKQAELFELFHRMDTNHDGFLSWEELQQRVVDKAPASSKFTPAPTQTKMKRCTTQRTLLDETLNCANISILDAKELFQMLDLDGSGTISKEEFLAAAMMASKPPTAMNLLQVSSRIHRTGTRLNALARGLQGLSDHLGDLSCGSCSAAQGAALPFSRSTKSTVGSPLHGHDTEEYSPVQAARSELNALRAEMMSAFAALGDRLSGQPSEIVQNNSESYIANVGAFGSEQSRVREVLSV